LSAAEEKRKKDKRDEVMLEVATAKQKVWDFTATTGKNAEPGTFIFDIEGAHFEIHREFLAMAIFEQNVRTYFRGQGRQFVIMSEGMQRKCERAAHKAKESARQAYARRPQKRSLVI